MPTSLWSRTPQRGSTSNGRLPGSLPPPLQTRSTLHGILRERRRTKSHGTPCSRTWSTIAGSRLGRRHCDASGPAMARSKSGPHVRAQAQELLPSRESLSGMQRSPCPPPRETVSEDLQYLRKRSGLVTVRIDLNGWTIPSTSKMQPRGFALQRLYTHPL